MAASMSSAGRVPALALAVALAALPRPAQAEPTVAVLPLGFAVEEFRPPQSYFARTLPTSPLLAEKLPLERPLVALWGKERGAAFHLDKGAPKQVPFALGDDGGTMPEAPRGAVPGTRMQSAGPLTAHLAAPRSDYRHGVFGGIDDAGEVAIREKQALAGVSAQARAVPIATSAVASGPEAVFEDLEPRLADLDGDGTPEIVVVRSDLQKGSSLAVLAKRDGVWRLAAETPPIGERHRWLAPAAIADFEGGGRPAIALVRTPHLQGVLQLWVYEAGKLVLRHEAVGYTNHVFGSTTLDNAAAVDLDGDGVPELAIPTQDRKSLAVLSLKGGIREIWRVPLPAPAGRGLAALGAGKDAHLLAALDDGRLVVVRP